MKQILILSLLAMFLMVPVVYAQDEYVPDDDLVINSIKGKSDRDIGVIFNHSSHGDYECSACHHRLKEDAVPVSCATENCHDMVQPDELRNPHSFFKAMHVKESRHQSCIQCHTEIAEGDKDMTGCTRSFCHSEGLY